ncbi:MAG TPA: insulinase family protein [Allosphingosinicella sp.]|nr:insulinase family protein [Allosphingosinicella sp.]
MSGPVDESSGRRLRAGARGAAAVLAAALAVAVPGGGAFAQITPEARTAWGFEGSDLAPDPAVRFGVLANGMRYAILGNAVPPGAVAIRMVVAAGATAGGPGEAHYLEHVAFMGSRRVPEGARTRLTRRERLTAGRDFNAHTGDTDTIYRVDLPRPDPAQLDRTIMLMREIASELSLTPETVERARNALIEEARQRSGPEDGRERDQIAFFLPGTAIARASLTGSEADVAAIRADGLRRLYELYYTPGRTILIVVGDADPARVESRIRAHFGDWRGRAPVAEPPPAPIDPARATAFRLFHAPSASTWVTIASVTALDARRDGAAQRDRGFLESLGADMLAARILGYRGADRPFMDADAQVQDYYRTARIVSLSVRSIDRDWQMALEVAEQALRSVLVHGFSQAELDIALSREAERLNGIAAPQASADLANRMAAMAGAGIIVTAPGRPADSAAYLARIRLDQVNAAFRAAWAAPGRLVHVAHGRAIDGGESRLAEAWAASRRRPVAAR